MLTRAKTEVLQDNIKNIFLKNQDIFYIVALFILCVLIFFVHLGSYRLIDIDETRYVNIARNMLYSKDFITPYLNFEPFLEKPPLYYWLIVLSYKVFGVINNFTSRFSVALTASIGVFGTYFFTFYIKKSRLFAFLSATILMSSFWYALFAHIAILDLGFCVFTMCALYFGVSTLFCENKNKKIALWCLGYLFLALSVLQKGLIGIIVPGSALLLIFLAFKKAKEIIKLEFIIPGIIVFLLIAAPWHYLVYKANGLVWFNDYIVKHHFARFLDSSIGIGRKQPFLFYLPIILGGFMPWSLFSIVSIMKWAKNAKEMLSSKNSIILISTIYFLTVFLFFSISSTKLPTYILPAFPPIAILCADIFYEYLKEDKNKKCVKIMAFISFFIFLTSSIAGLYCYFAKIIEIGLVFSICSLICSIFGFASIFKNNKILLYIMIFSFSIITFSISSKELLNYVTSSGQKELEEYALKINNDKEAVSVITLGFARKYSMSNIYSKGKINFIPDTGDAKYIEFQKITNEIGRKGVYLITKNKKTYKWHYLTPLEKIESGKKYTLYKLK